MRSSNRAAFGPQRGSKNPVVTVGNTFPYNPKGNDIFIDIHSNYIFRYDFDDSFWIPVGGSVSHWEAGENLYRGEVIYCNQSDGLLYKAPTSNDMPIGVMLYDCTLGDFAYFVRCGICFVLPESGLSLSKGYVMYTSSSEAGRVDNSSTVPVAATHFRECGHPLQDSTGNGVLTKCIVHFN